MCSSVATVAAPTLGRRISRPLTSATFVRHANGRSTDKLSSATKKAVDSLKTDPTNKDSIEKAEKALNEATAKASQLSKDYDVWAKTKQALGAVGGLTDSAIDKSLELEKEYKVLDKVKESASKAVDEVKKSAN